MAALPKVSIQIQHKMKNRNLFNLLDQPAACLVVLWFVVSVAGAGLVHGQSNSNPGVAPPQSVPYGKTYGAWLAAFRQWHTGIPAARNPYADETGEFCGEEQEGPVWFLASALSAGTYVRECHVPAGKALYVPLIGFMSWGPEDLEISAFVVETFLGLDPATLTDEEIIRLGANWVIDSTTSLSLTVDGVAFQDLFAYRAESPAFDMLDTSLYDDLGIPYSHPNLTVAVGYGVILYPLANGLHTIEIHAELDNPALGQVELDITYHLRMGR